MSPWHTAERCAEAYPQAQRRAHAEQHLLICAERGWLSVTSCSHIARTYGVSDIITDLRALKKSLFPEFACGDGK
jgi:hypothetical protein